MTVTATLRAEEYDYTLLTDEQRYRIEVTRELQRISFSWKSPVERHQRERELIEQARDEDQQAYQHIIIALQPVVMRFAGRFYQARSWEVPGLRYLDFVDEANLKMLESLDRALAKDHAFAYLTLVAYKAIQDYYKQYKSLIVTPLTIGVLPYTVESLHAPLSFEDDTQTLLDIIGCDPLEPVRTKDASIQDFAQLHEAVNALSEQQRTIIIRHFGLLDHAPEPLCDLDRSFGWNHTTSHNAKYKALLKLHGSLEEVYPHYANGTGFRPAEPRSTNTTTRLDPIQVERLDQAAATLQASGRRITCESLRQESHVGAHSVLVYLQQQRAATLAPSREQRLEEAYTTLQTQGKKITVRSLSAQSGVDQARAGIFLKHKPEQRETPHERIARIYNEMLARGEKITGVRLAKEARANSNTVHNFLREVRYMKPQCAWCNEEQGQSQGSGSHGICQRHAEQVLQAHRQRRQQHQEVPV